MSKECRLSYRPINCRVICSTDSNRYRQKAAASLIFGVSRQVHVTPLFRRLHWVRVPERIAFRLAVLVYGRLPICLHGTAPAASAIEVLGSPDHGYGTICPLNCDSKTFVSPSLGGYLRHFCSLRLGALWLLCFNGAGYKHSYLLTYISKRRRWHGGLYVCCRWRVLSTDMGLRQLLANYFGRSDGRRFVSRPIWRCTYRYYP